MRTSLALILSTAVFGFSASSWAGPTRRPDLNAFINRKVVNSQGLVNQVRNDPEVADRYQRHFAMSRAELLDYLGGLRPGKLAKSEVFTVYSVPEDGRVKMHRERLKAGAPIFVDRVGRPTLVMKCGNPLVLGPSRARKGNPDTVIPIENDSTRMVSMLEPRDVPLLEIDEEDLLAAVPPIPETIVTELIPVAPPEAFVPVSTVAATATRGGFPLLAGLPFLLPLFGAFDHNGNGGGFNPVPEPASIAALAVGALAITRRRRKG